MMIESDYQIATAFTKAGKWISAAIDDPNCSPWCKKDFENLFAAFDNWFLDHGSFEEEFEQVLDDDDDLFSADDQGSSKMTYQDNHGMATWYFVRDCNMHSGYPLARVSIVGHALCDNVQVASMLLGQVSPSADAAAMGQRFERLIEHPGTWFLMSSMNVVHEDDLFWTREQAADNFRNQLLEDV